MKVFSMNFAKNFGCHNEMNTNDPYDLNRFLLAQKNMYEQALFEIKNGRTAYEIFGDIDKLKVWSCATLFANISTTESVFEYLLNKYYNGKHDSNTLRVMNIITNIE